MPEFPNAESITIRHLLTHTSGLPQLWGEGNIESPYVADFEQLVLANLDRAFTVDEILAFVRDRPLQFEPGRAADYSNVNTILLGKIVEAVTDTDLASALRVRILDPLGLERTYFAAAEAGPAPTSGVFTLNEGGTRLNTADFPSRGLLTIVGASAAMVSSVDDLLVWADQFLRAATIGADSLAGTRFEITPDGLGLGVLVWAPGFGACVFSRGCPPGTPLLGVAGVGILPGTSSFIGYFPRWTPRSWPSPTPTRLTSAMTSSHVSLYRSSGVRSATADHARSPKWLDIHADRSTA